MEKEKVFDLGSRIEAIDHTVEGLWAPFFLKNKVSLITCLRVLQTQASDLAWELQTENLEPEKSPSHD